MKYYIVSLKHTSPNHPCLTFWCPNDAGYTHFIEHAGVYENLTKGYHDNAEHCFPVLVETAKEIMVKAIFNEILGHVVLTDQRELDFLGINRKQLLSSYNAKTDIFIPWSRVKQLAF